MNKKLAVAFLWHMHQPLYKDMITGKYHLPWVRLHSTYSYLDMASVLNEFPAIRCTFNLTPILIYQLMDISGPGELDDIFYQLSLKPAATLSEDDKCFILKNFFSCSVNTAITPVRKYAELYYRRGERLDDATLRKKAREFSAQDLLDLQVFFNLAWCGFTLRERDDLVRGLFNKGGNYSEKDKIDLMNCQMAVVRSILPMYKRLQDEGKIEISTTPYYHPILPLLTKGVNKQGFDFHEDAEWHVKAAVKLYEEVFGRKPVGMWPAEGAVSPDVVPVFTKCGIKWLATDEGIAHESFKGENVHRDDLIFNAYEVSHAGKKISIVFRDVNLSNDISFRYSGMSGEDSSSELFRNILNIKALLDKKRGDHILSVILDGENPWPYYPDGGKSFLRETFRLLSLSDGVYTTTIGEYIKRHKKKELKKLHSGSWINKDFSKWIGSNQKNKAWALLKRTREDLFASGGEIPADAMRELYIAEGSDWFWWYDDFGTELNYVFDDIYRMHLQNIYTIIGRKVPEYLMRPVYPPHAASGEEVPGVMIPPVIDGEITEGFEWVAARVIRTRELSAVMVRTDAAIDEIGYGVDRANLYIMVKPHQGRFEKEVSIEVSVAGPVRISCEVPVDMSNKGAIAAWDASGKNEKKNDSVTFACGRIVEMAVPFKEIGAAPGDEVNFRINVKRKGIVAESWPSGEFFKVIVPA